MEMALAINSTYLVQMVFQLSFGVLGLSDSLGKSQVGGVRLFTYVVGRLLQNSINGGA